MDAAQAEALATELMDFAKKEGTDPMKLGLTMLTMALEAQGFDVTAGIKEIKKRGAESFHGGSRRDIVEASAPFLLEGLRAARDEEFRHAWIREDGPRKLVGIMAIAQTCDDLACIILGYELEQLHRKEVSDAQG